MTLDRKDYKSAIPQLESRLAQIEKLGKDVFNKFEDIAHKTQLDAAEAEKKVAALDYQIDSINVVTEYQLQTTGQDPVEANWSTTMPSITYSSYNGKTLWCRSVTYQNDIAVRKTAPQKVQLMDGLYTFVNSASGNTGWTMIDGDFIQTGKIASTNGYSYFDIDNNSFQMKDASTVANSNSVLAWQNGLLYVKGKIAVGSSSTDQKYYTEMTGGGFDIVANDVNLAHIGYGSGAAESGTAVAPYYTLGIRASDTSAGDRGNYSVAEGYNVTASEYASHAEGGNTIADGLYSHAEGCKTYTSNAGAHAEGYAYNGQIIASGMGAHAEGYSLDRNIEASGHGSHAEGCDTRAEGLYSHAGGKGTTAVTRSQMTIGEYNKLDTAEGTPSGNRGKYVFIAGNGTSNTARSNAFAVDWYGKLYTKQIQAGSISGTAIASGNVRTETVTFQQSMSATPIVVASLISSSTSADIGSISVGVHDVSSTGFTCKIFNNSGSSRSPAVNWIAVNVGLP